MASGRGVINQVLLIQIGSLSIALKGGNRIEIVLSDHYRDYGGMKLDPIVVEKS